MELAAMKPAAVIYCVGLGIDPNETVSEPHPFIQGATTQRPMWEVVAERMVDLTRLLSAIRRAGEQAKGAAKKPDQEAVRS